MRKTSAGRKRFPTDPNILGGGAPIELRTREDMAEILRTTVLDDSWATFLKADVRLDDGVEVSRQIVSHGHAAVVLPYDPIARRVLMVRLLRAPALYAEGLQAVTEAVAGMIDPGETAEDAARREAMEEVGVRLKALEPVGTYWATPGISTERMTLFLAPYTQADRLTGGGGVEGEHEGIEVLELSLDDMKRMLEQGQLQDMKILALAQALQLRHPELFQA
ncbi:NUDIX domain-containing protein [Caulobacter sp. S45]|uniref:NUDIX domain-containing protein n=1 Tax=Caulobacter sp. S45 TaxID=1641861 RepID=UPI001C20BD14|nr:NUDIX hydrolase [Caulobacter sp. S45]